jgi:hypothetical protein
MMKSRILDVSDCSESPMLASSKCRRKWARPSPTDLFHLRRSSFQSKRRSDLISRLTEANLGAAMPMDSLPTQLPTVENVNISYQARCAERWWAEFSRWFGSLNQ